MWWGKLVTPQLSSNPLGGTKHSNSSRMICPVCHKWASVTLGDVLFTKDLHTYKPDHKPPKDIMVCPRCGAFLTQDGFTKRIWFVIVPLVSLFALFLLFTKRMVFLLGAQYTSELFKSFSGIVIIGFLYFGLRRCIRLKQVDVPDNATHLAKFGWFRRK